MKTVGAYEAKTHLTRLLDEVAGGQRITITRHGVPVATLQSAEAQRSQPAAEVIAELKGFRRGHRLGGVKVRELIEEGRR